jgi:hypothetical protein
MTGPAKYRKVPRVVEAWRWDGTHGGADRIAVWSNGHVTVDYTCGFLTVETGAGEVVAEKGDWIIKGTKGEFYPCKPDIFNDVYEVAE